MKSSAIANVYAVILALIGTVAADKQVLILASIFCCTALICSAVEKRA